MKSFMFWKAFVSVLTEWFAQIAAILYFFALSSNFDGVFWLLKFDMLFCIFFKDEFLYGEADALKLAPKLSPSTWSAGTEIVSMKPSREIW